MNRATEPRSVRLSVLALLPLLLAAHQEKIPTPPAAPQAKRPAEPAVKVEEPMTRTTVSAIGEPAVLAGERAAEISRVAPSIDLDRVHVDRPGDGAIWAHGANWKARFGTSGAKYIPFFGSDAPRNYPLAFSLESVTAGGEPVAFEEEAEPAALDEVVLFDRGTLVELYDLRPDSVEQSFVFAGLPAFGELVIRIGVATELAPFAASDGLEFTNERGKVAYGKAVVFDAAGRTGPVDLRLEGSSIALRVSADFLAQATFPVTVDPFVATFSVFSHPTYSSFNVDVSYDVTADRYLAVFQQAFSSTDHDVVSSLLDSQGSSIIDQYVDDTDQYWSRPKVANNNLAEQFLIVAEVSTNAGGPPWIVRGRTQQAGSAAISAAFTISGFEPGDSIRPDVGGDPVTAPPTYYCVVWQNRVSATDTDIVYQLVRADRTLVFPSTRTIDVSSATLDVIPRISKSDGTEPYSTQRWNVVWNRIFSPQDSDIRGAQITWDGVVVSPSFSIDASTSDDDAPVASSLHDRGSGERDWMVAFERWFGNERDIVGYALNGSVKVTPATNLSGLEADDGSGTWFEDQSLPSIDSDGSKFVIAYVESVPASTTNLDPFIASFDVVGSSIRLTEGHAQPLQSSIPEWSPQVASQHSSGGPAGRCFAAWHMQNSSSYSTIWGALYEALPYQLFCSPWSDTMPCPCGNDPLGPGRGCQNSAATGGAILLVASGSPSSDTVVLQAIQMRPSSICIFFQGNGVNYSGLAYGDGVRCAAGTIKRLYMKPATTGWADAPTGADPSIKTRSAALGDPILPGTTRWYQVYYRDPASYACPSPATYNTTSGVIIDW